MWAGDWSSPPGDDPLVLVGLSSTFMDHGGVLQGITTALGDLPVRGVVTTGPAIDPASIHAPANVQVVRSAPHNQVLARAAAVITHAGHGTVIKSLAAGVPPVCLPLGRDQLDNAARVAAHGAGVRLSKKAKPSAVAAAVTKVSRIRPSRQLPGGRPRPSPRTSVRTAPSPSSRSSPRF